MQKTWFITGASRGLGQCIALAAMKAGDRVVATGRHREAIIKNLGDDSETLLAVELDVTNANQAHDAVKKALARFGGIDVLVNNAGYGHLGFFEENTMEDVKEQFNTNLYGVFNVTWEILPIMRLAKSGRIFNISSTAGIRGNELCSLYCASKFALEGFSESLAKEVNPFGVYVTIVEPGPFRTDFLTKESIRFGENEIEEYNDRRDTLRKSFEDRDGSQPGDPERLAEAIINIANHPQPPMRFVAGSIAIDTLSSKLESTRAELEAWRQLSASLDYDSI